MNQPNETVAAAANRIEFVSFSVAQQKFCLEITKVREIRRWSPVTVLPYAPSDVLGVMNLRGAVIPVYDLAQRFGLGRTEHNDRNVVIVAAVNAQMFGLLIESVSEIVSIMPDDIQETPEVRSQATRGSIMGVITVNEQMVRIINLDSIIESAEALSA